MTDKSPYNKYDLPEISQTKSPEVVLIELKNELRDHVTRVLGFSSLLLNVRELDSDKREEYLLSILGSARYMEALLKLVSDYLEKKDIT